MLGGRECSLVYRTRAQQEPHNQLTPSSKGSDDLTMLDVVALTCNLGT